MTPAPREYNIATTPTPPTTVREVLTFVAVAVVLGGIAVFAMIGPFTPDTIRYSYVYATNRDRVIVDKKPHDCDWDHAPLGNKNCHYEKDVSVVRDANGGSPYVYVTWMRVSD